MFCPKCRSEFREGFSHCAECDVALVENLSDIISNESVESGTYVEEDEYYKDSDNVLVASPGCLLCPECHVEYRDDFVQCSECKVDLVEEVWINSFGENVDTSVASIDLEGHEFHTDMSQFKHVILIESDDIEILKPLVDVLNDNKVLFEFVEAEHEEESLGGILATSVHAEPRLHKILVKQEDEEKGFTLMQQALNQTLEIPSELHEEYEEINEECEEEDDE